ncbi:Glucose--fructose oxidoreductase precursor [Thalassoglobus neptunius]|uniref:Glucose--fructose oxidoreductase n=1 Tax=Thalassoglobus neptunius TaxID=1938619 RepID=A0A5C5X6X6_9PLAN|nr:Gfo/Idh/MocA family oxidoreductase [Thalassoglobus neptunius]TWT58796.1 Glucose--fructose oxidoreductase precursor [Thalassoglobus neptunius]
MNAQNRLKLGILGCGRIVTRRILPALSECPEHWSVVVASQRPGVADEVASEVDGVTASDSYEAILADDSIAAVYIPATGDQHRELTIAAAKAGKHVLCEKPLAPSIEEAEEMVRACEDHNVILQEAFMWRLHPRALQIRELIEKNEIGNLRLIVVNFSFNIDRNDWRLNPDRGGGAMWDLGCYGVNASRFFTDAEPTKINAGAHWWPSGVDMSMRIGLTFPGEVLAQIDCSFEAPFRCRLELVGDDGRILVEPAFQPGQQPTFELWRSSERDTPVEVISCPSDDQYACQLKHFHRSIESGELRAPAENGLQNMKIMDSILKVARESR